ncbi:hypothetical protein FJZ33_10180, partial [Candidatus Poribacteria bacterium]|nr:hypothetical protein [Candidatus Poribacteria bacterium]
MKNSFYHALYTIIWTLFLISGVFAQDWSSVVNLPGNWPNVDFNDLYFTDGPAWAVGKYGTIINYNGIRWQDQISNTQLELRGVHFVNTLEGWIVGDNGIILRTEDGGNIWKHQNKTGNLYDVCFVNNKYGWAVGSNGTVLRTNDGNTWTQVPIPEKYRNYNMLGVYFHNADNGWVVGENGTILYWNGNGWQEQQQNISSANLYGVFFTSSLDGWIVGDQGTILYTNSGWLWNSGKSRAPATNANLRSIHFPKNQSQYGWIVGENGTIFYTANYGTHWFSQKPLDTRNLKAVYAVSSSEVWAVGSNGSVIRTTDRGTNWNVFVNPAYGNLWDVSFRANWSFDNIRTLDGWIVGDNGVILRSKDDGASWYQYPSPTNKNLYSICMLGKDYGWAVGENGTIIKIKGSNWDLDPSITNSHLRSVHLSPATPTISNGWAVGDNGIILRWNDLERTWAPQNSGVSSDLYGVFSIGNNEGWAVGKNATILRTTNGGLNWNRMDVSSSKPNINFYQVYFHNSNNGWIVGDSGIVLYWHGGKLTEQKSNTLLSLFDVDFVDSTRGWISGEKGMIV